MKVRERQTGHLYFVASRQQECMKVGFATDLYTRLASLQSGNPAPLELFAAIPATAFAERVFHSVMKPHRIIREWYPEDALLHCLGAELLEFWDAGCRGSRS